MNEEITNSSNAGSGFLNENHAQPPVAAPINGLSARSNVVAAASLGNLLEMFDFTVFAYFAAIIGSNFFPLSDPTGQLLLSLATFGTGFLARPIGSFVIGAYADRHGRVAALTMTIVLMTLGTAIIAFTPPYASIGITAPLMVLAGRLLQGFSAGGEVGAATTYLMEAGTTARRGFMVSWQIVSQGIAMLLGALSGFVLSVYLPHDALYSWGWRVPFVAGLTIGPIGMYMRRSLNETHRSDMGAAPPLRELLHSFLGRLLQGILLVVGSTSTTYIVGVYMPIYSSRSLHLPSAISFMSACAGGLALTLGAIISGQLTDRMVKRKPMLLAAFGAMFLLTYPMFKVMTTHPSIGVVVTSVFLMLFISGLSSSPFFLVILELFPRRVRVSGISIVYGIGVTLFGGFAQFNVTWLLRSTGEPMSIAWYLLVASGVSFLALSALREGTYQD